MDFTSLKSLDSKANKAILVTADGYGIFRIVNILSLSIIIISVLLIIVGIISGLLG